MFDKDGGCLNASRALSEKDGALYEDDATLYDDSGTLFDAGLRLYEGFSSSLGLSPSQQPIKSLQPTDPTTSENAHSHSFRRVWTD